MTKLIKSNPTEFNQLMSNKNNYGKNIENEYAFIDVYEIKERFVTFKKNNIETQMIH